MERLYPLPLDELAHVLADYRHVTDVRWVQEEPINQGAYPYMNNHLAAELSAKLPGGLLDRMAVVARPESSAPSVGQQSIHLKEQRILMDQAFTTE